MIGLEKEKGEVSTISKLCGYKHWTAKLLILALFVLIIWQLLRMLGIGPSPNFPSVNVSEWQAVFLTNNQVYFGHLQDYNEGYTTLKDIFYLRVAEPLQQGATPGGPTLNLAKLGSELHGPQDLMYIPKDKIMFWENLRKDSNVVQAISAFLSPQKR